MKPYIFGKRNLIHLIDVRGTTRGLIIGRKFVEAICSQGKDVLFVGTKHQARTCVKNQALRCGMHYVTERWLGGTLTNFRTIRSRLSRLTELEEMERTGEMEQFSKKMVATLTREKEKIQQNLEGIRNMERLPGVLVIIDPGREKNAVAEARKLKIPIVALTDTDCDPTVVNILIPGNDDAMRAVEIVCSTMANAALAGKAKVPQAPVVPLEKPAERPEAPVQRQRRQRPQGPRVQARRRAPAPAAPAVSSKPIEPAQAPAANDRARTAAPTTPQPEKEKAVNATPQPPQKQPPPQTPPPSEGPKTKTDNS